MFLESYNTAGPICSRTIKLYILIKSPLYFLSIPSHQNFLDLLSIQDFPGKQIIDRLYTQTNYQNIPFYCLSNNNMSSITERAKQEHVRLKVNTLNICNTTLTEFDFVRNVLNVLLNNWLLQRLCIVFMVSLTILDCI